MTLNTRNEDDVFARIEINPSGATSRSGRILLAGLGVFMAWAVFIPLGSAVVAPASLASSGRNQILQHVAGGVITGINVEEGALIDQGEVVLELDPAIDQARLTKLRGRHAVLQALRGRLEAEKDADSGVNALLGVTAPMQGADGAEIDPMATASVSGTTVERALNAEQIREYEKGRNEIAAQIRALADRAQGLTQRTSELGMQIDNGGKRIELLRRQLANAETLVASGALARQQVWDLQARVLEAESSLSELRAQFASATGSVGETYAEMERIRMNDGRETSKQLTEVIAEIEQISDELAAAELARRQSTMRAPVRGYLMNLATTTIGGVIRPGETIAEIVPADAPLEARGRVLLQDIAAVQVGQAAEVRVSALNPRIHDRLPATVIYVAADATLDERTGERFFDVRALVDASSLAGSGIVLQPGMNGEIYIEGDSRTFATYMVQPLLDSLSRAFREVY